MAKRVDPGFSLSLITASPPKKKISFQMSNSFDREVQEKVVCILSELH